MADYVVVADIGGTNIRMGVFSFEGECLVEERWATREFVDFDVFVCRLEKIIQGAAPSLPDMRKPVGIGLAAPSVSKSGVLIAPANLPWGRQHLAEILSARLHLPVVAMNDANAAAIGERHFGAARGLKNFAVITLGTGVGCGLVLNDRLVEGRNGFAGEFGHITAVPGGRQCGCGKRGCLETYVSAPGICRTASELMISENSSTPLAEIPRSQITAELIANVAKKGDPLAKKVFDITGAILGRSLADLALLIDPEAFILAGGVSQSLDLLEKPLRQTFEENLLPVQKNSIEVLRTGIGGDRAALLGLTAYVKNVVELSGPAERRTG